MAKLKKKMDQKVDQERDSFLAKYLSETSLLSPQQVSTKYNMSTDFLQDLRKEGTGPDYIKMGRSVRYKWESVLAYVENNTYRSTSEYGRC